MFLTYCSIRAPAPIAFSRCSATSWRWFSSYENQMLVMPLAMSVRLTRDAISTAYLANRRQRSFMRSPYHQARQWSSPTLFSAWSRFPHCSVATSFDDPVGDQNRRRNRDAERLGRAQAHYHQLESCGLLDGKLGGLC